MGLIVGPRGHASGSRLRVLLGRAELIGKADDDVWIDPPRVGAHLQSTHAALRAYGTLGQTQLREELWAGSGRFEPGSAGSLPDPAHKFSAL